MRLNSTTLVTVLLCALAGSVAMVSTSQSPSDRGANVEAQYTLSVCFVQVHLALQNTGRDIVALPLCGESNMCDFNVLLEQAQDPQGKYWRRTSPHLVGDVSFTRTAEIKKGESLAAIFRFNPLDWEFEDGTRLRYPGRVRLVVRAWQKKEWVGHDSLALELVSNSFDIPSPPTVWGTRAH